MNQMWKILFISAIVGCAAASNPLYNGIYTQGAYSNFNKSANTAPVSVTTSSCPVAALINHTIDEPLNCAGSKYVGQDINNCCNWAAYWERPVDTHVRIDFTTIGPSPGVVINRFHHLLDCVPTAKPVPYDEFCEDAGDVNTYKGDVNIQTDCPTAWHSDYPNGSGAAHSVVFTAETPFRIPPGFIGYPTPYCSLWFNDLQVADSTYGGKSYYMATAFNYRDDDAVCDDGRNSSALDNNQMWICPVDLGCHSSLNCCNGCAAMP